MKTTYAIREVKNYLGTIRNYIYRNSIDEKQALNEIYARLQEVNKSWEWAWPDKLFEVDIVEINE